jgi:hypothetical protein
MFSVQLDSELNKQGYVRAAAAEAGPNIPSSRNPRLAPPFLAAVSLVSGFAD